MRARSADAELVVRRAVWRRRRDGRRRAAVIAKMMAVLARLPAASARRVRAAPAARIVQVEARAAVSDIFAPDEIKENPNAVRRVWRPRGLAGRKDAGMPAARVPA